MNTNRYFKPGFLTTILDAQFGSSGKGKLASFVTSHADNFQFACNAFSAQAGHWVVHEDGTKHFYQHLNSCAYDPSKFEKLYIGPASCIELPALFREIEENRVKPRQLGISPLATIILKRDFEYEKGFAKFDEDAGDDSRNWHTGTALTGSTCHGVGSATARKILRRPSVVLARDIPELQEFLCDVSSEIIDRLQRGQAGLLEIAQGFPLSLNSQFYPFCTSRNVTVSQGLADMFLPPVYAGPVILNFRTYPIRINSNKYIGKDGTHLTWQQVTDGVEHRVIQGNSGGWYPDQKEVTWEDVTRLSGSPEPIFEITSVTKLPRRVATFSKINAAEAVRYNLTGHPVTLSINFANYVDASLFGKREEKDLTKKFLDWAVDNLGDLREHIEFVGTGPKTDDMVLL